MNPVKDATSLLELRRLLRLYKPDITLGYYIKPVIYGTIAAWLAGVPRRYAMIEGLGFAFTEGQRPSWRRASLQRIVAKLSRSALRLAERERKRVVEGKSVSVRVGLGGGRIIKK